MISHKGRRKRADLLSPAQQRRILRHLETMRYPQRNRVLFLLSLKAGLRARDISGLSWSMVTDQNGRISDMMSLKVRRVTGIKSHRIPIHPALREALIHLHHKEQPKIQPDLPVICSERGEGNGLSPASVGLWFHRLYRTLGMDGYSSHSGRRTFITRAAQKVGQVGGSLCDVQRLAGHADLRNTQHYVEEKPAAQQKLISLL